MFANTREELFLRANKYYAEKDYDNALETYDMIDKKGSAVLYNMGNCYYHQQNYPYALVYWSRAEIGANHDEYSRIQHNKELALKALGKQKELSWWQFIIEFLQSQLSHISLLMLQLLFLLSWFVLILGLRTKQTGRKKIAHRVISLCAVVCAIFLGLQYAQYDISSAIVVKKDGKLFAGPDKSFHVLSGVVYAESATVKETRAGWHKIQYADMIGWVESDVIQII